MTKTEMKEMIAELVEQLRELPDGFEITSGQMLSYCGYDPEKFGYNELFAYHDALLHAARNNHITLDMSKHEGRDEGLPWNLDFVVRNDEAQMKCPHCGSRNTGVIYYGDLAFDELMQDKLDAGRIHIGGCLVHLIKLQDGRKVIMGPRRYCNECGKRFGAPAYRQDKETVKYYPDLVKEIRYTEYVHHFPKVDVHLVNNDRGVTVSDRSAVWTQKDCDEYEWQISQRKWKNLTEKLYNRLFLADWDRNYDRSFTNEKVLLEDGVMWSLKIKLDQGIEEYRGSALFMPYWEELRSSIIRLRRSNKD